MATSNSPCPARLAASTAQPRLRKPPARPPAVALPTPVPGGNVSFYNQTGEEPILPTPVVGVLGVIDDVHKAIGNELGTVGEKEILIALGETKDEFGGSIWQQVSADTSDASSLNGLPPQVDMANEKRLAEFFHGNDLLTVDDSFTYNPEPQQPADADEHGEKGEESEEGK